MRFSRRMQAQDGQMTIEFVAVFPVLLIVALVAMNALLFFSECAAFDRAFRESVCLLAASPGYGSGASQSAAQVQDNVNQVLDSQVSEASVSVQGGGVGLSTFSATLTFHPTLFGQGSLSSVFGVSLPTLTHQAQMSIDCYKPGVLI